jgi:hypothetical protein
MGVVLAWFIGEGIVTYRWIKAGAPPTPGALAVSSGFFLLCALIGEYPQAKTAATLLAAGIDIAALLQIIGKAPAAQATGWPPPGYTGNGILPGGTAAAAGSGSGSSGSTSTGSGWNIWTGSL